MPSMVIDNNIDAVFLLRPYGREDKGDILTPRCAPYGCLRGATHGCAQTCAGRFAAPAPTSLLLSTHSALLFLFFINILPNSR